MSDAFTVADPARVPSGLNPGGTSYIGGCSQSARELDKYIQTGEPE